MRCDHGTSRHFPGWQYLLSSIHFCFLPDEPNFAVLCNQLWLAGHTRPVSLFLHSRPRQFHCHDLHLLFVADGRSLSEVPASSSEPETSVVSRPTCSSISSLLRARSPGRRRRPRTSTSIGASFLCRYITLPGPLSVFGLLLDSNVASLELSGLALKLPQVVAFNAFSYTHRSTIST